MPNNNRMARRFRVLKHTDSTIYTMVVADVGPNTSHAVYATFLALQSAKLEDYLNTLQMFLVGLGENDVRATLLSTEAEIDNPSECPYTGDLIQVYIIDPQMQFSVINFKLTRAPSHHNEDALVIDIQVIDSVTSSVVYFGSGTLLEGVQSSPINITISGAVQNRIYILHITSMNPADEYTPILDIKLHNH